jgi:hypothetical protein
MASIPTDSTPTSLGSRRSKPAKPIPRLPLSAFSPPSSGTGERFPLPPSPTTVHPQAVYDASVTISSIDALTAYSAALGNSLSTRLSGVVVSVPESAVGSVDQMCVITFLIEMGLSVLTLLLAFSISSSKVPVLAISVPLSDSSASTSAANVKVVSNTAFTRTSSELVQSVKGALSGGVVEINVKSDLSSDAGWEALEEFLTAVLEGSDPEATKPAIVLCKYLNRRVELNLTPVIYSANILPPPNSLERTTVSLLSHPSYLAYQAHSATLSFYEPVYIRLSPPEWGTAIPSDASAVSEWTNRLKMYRT